MKTLRRGVLAMAVLATLLVAGWWFAWQGGNLAFSSQGPAKPTTPVAATARDRAAKPDGSATVDGAPLSATRKPIVTLFNEEHDGPAFLKALLATPGLSPQDRAYYRAAALTRCTQVKPTLPAAAGPALPTDAIVVMKEVQVAKPPGPILDNDPNAPMRRALNERLAKRSINAFCKDVAPLPDAELDRLWQAAATLGDKRSQAILADRQLRHSLKPLPGAPALPDGSHMMVLEKPSPGYLATVTAGMAEGDPSGILSLGPLLQQSFLEGSYVFGPLKETLSMEGGKALWELLACDAGADCTPFGSHLLMNACASRALCNIPDLDTYYRGHQLSEDDMAQVDRLRPLFREAMRSGDWSFIQYQSPRTTQNNFTLGRNHRIRLRS